MGPPPRSRTTWPQNRSRFQEGSMNDRASAAPPVFFIDPEEEARKEEEKWKKENGGGGVVDPLRHLLAQKETMGPSMTTTVRPVSIDRPRGQQTTQPPVLSKRGSKQLFGQVWDGVLGKLRMRREPAAGGEEEGGRRKKKGIAATSTTAGGTTTAVAPPPAGLAPPTEYNMGKPSKEDQRPSKEEVYANYHQLVASGFFSSHAIQSTRQPPPGSATPAARPSPRPTRSHAALVTSPSSAQAAPASAATTTPQWPLTPTPTKPLSPVLSPTSAASSRGTKRPSIAADDMDRDDDEEGGGEGARGTDALLHQHQRKLRKTASTSRDLAVPRTRSSSRALGLARRSFSNGLRVPSGSLTMGGGEAMDQQRREPNKLTKRVLSKLPSNNGTDGDDAHLQVPGRKSSARRNVSESHKPKPADTTTTTTTPPLQQQQAQPTPTANNTRVLRPRRSAAEPLRVKPDANRGIPTVPHIPVKFTYGEDRENDGPWKGLRRPNNAQLNSS